MWTLKRMDANATCFHRRRVFTYLIGISILLCKAVQAQTEASRNPYYLAPSNESCYDYFKWSTYTGNWSAFGGNWDTDTDIQGNCSTISQSINDQVYDNEDSLCGYFGDLEDAFSGAPATEGCCVCGGGIRDSNLTGNTIRAGIPKRNSSSIFSFFVNSSKDVDGSIIRFVEDVSRSVGLGIEEVDYSSSDFSECIQELVSGENIDVCLGNFWEASNRKVVAESTNLLFPDLFYLLTRVKHDGSFVEILRHVGDPFSVDLWLIILAALIFMCLGSAIVRSNPHDHEWRVRGNIFKRIIKILRKSITSLFVALRQCAALEAYEVQDKTSISEHLILFGFIIFSVLCITGYGAKFTANLVNDDDQLQYTSIADAIAKNATVCFSNSLRAEMRYLYPALVNVNTTTGNITSLVEYVRSEIYCDVAIVQSYGFDAYSLRQKEEDNNDICDDVRIVNDEIILNVPNVLFASRAFATTSMGKEFISMINTHIDNLIYTARYHNDYYVKLKDVGFSLEELADQEKTRRLQEMSSNNFSAVGSQGYECHVDNNADESEPFQFSVLSFPVFFAIACTVLAIGIWIVTVLRDEKRVTYDKKWEENLRESRMSIYNGANVTSSFVDDEVLYFTWSFNRMTIKEVMDYLRELQVDNEIIRKSLNELPDKSSLRELFVHEKLSSASRTFKQLNLLSITELCDILDEVGDVEEAVKETSESEWESLLEEEDPKRLLVEKVMANAASRGLAMKRLDGMTSLHQNGGGEN